MIDKIAKYRKAVVASVPAVVLIVGQFAGVDSPVYAQVVAVLVALGVYAVPNKAV